MAPEALPALTEEFTPGGSAILGANADRFLVGIAPIPPDHDLTGWGGADGVRWMAGTFAT